MKRVQQGFTLIELMIVVAIVGILAAIALPAYQDYVVRSKMSEPVAAIAACKTSIQEFASTKNSFPSNISEAGCSTTASQYLASMAIASSTTAATITASSTNTGAGNCDLRLISLGGSSSTITGWTGSSSCLSKYVPANFR